MPLFTAKAVITVDDLLSHMSDLQITQPQRKAAEQIIIGRQSEAEMYCNRPLQAVHIREVLMPDSCGFLNPTITPVHRIIKVQKATGEGNEDVEITPITETPMADLTGPEMEMRTIDKTATALQEYSQTANGIAFFGPGRYIVEYIGGYIGYYDEGLRQLMLTVCAREFEGNADDSLTLKSDGTSEQAEQSDTRQKGWTDAELKRLDRIRRRVISR